MSLVARMENGAHEMHGHELRHICNVLTMESIVAVTVVHVTATGRHFKSYIYECHDPSKVCAT